MMSAKNLSLAVVLFTALTLTHAAFVDYRSGAAQAQPQFESIQDSKRIAVVTAPNQMTYLQARKMAGAELLLDVGNKSDRRGIVWWRGDTRSKWTESGLCCGVFELLVRMRGGATRVALLKSLREPKNKLQLSHELDIDWKAVDGHIAKLIQFSLVEETLMVGTCKIYSITQKGRRALDLVERLEPGSIECSRGSSEE
ncbi:MAG TPA: hypothetical protein VF172_13480 [Nitrososphaera sp.]|jgi:hypothetical protein